MKILNRPAAVNPINKVVQIRHCRYWTGRLYNRGKSEDLQSDRSKSFRGNKAKEKRMDPILPLSHRMLFILTNKK